MGSLQFDSARRTRHAETPGARLGGLLWDAARFAASLATPPWCRHCGEPLLGQRLPYLCVSCLETVQWIGKGACATCGFPAGPHASAGDRCRHCRRVDLPLTGAAAVARYARGARSLVTSLKFRGESELAVPMAKLMTERFRQAGMPRCDLVLPVPLFAARRRQRGFNQAALLASPVAAGLGFEFAERILRKTRHTKPQSSLRRRERLDSPRDAYKAEADLSGAKILLVDDVITTGATVGECAKACRAAGAARVYALAFAR